MYEPFTKEEIDTCKNLYKNISFSMTNSLSAFAEFFLNENIFGGTVVGFTSQSLAAIKKLLSIDINNNIKQIYKFIKKMNFNDAKDRTIKINNYIKHLKDFVDKFEERNEILYQLLLKQKEEFVEKITNQKSINDNIVAICDSTITAINNRIENLNECIDEKDLDVAYSVFLKSINFIDDIDYNRMNKKLNNILSDLKHCNNSFCKNISNFIDVFLVININTENKIENIEQYKECKNIYNNIILNYENFKQFFTDKNNEYIEIKNNIMDNLEICLKSVLSMKTINNEFNNYISSLKRFHEIDINDYKIIKGITDRFLDRIKMFII